MNRRDDSTKKPSLDSGRGGTEAGFAGRSVKGDAAIAPAQAEQRAQFMLLMRARGIRYLDLLRALERSPRSLFIPQRYADIAWRDIALPIGCGQTAPPPSIAAAMIEALTLDPRHKVLEIGAGAGYATALIARLAGHVLALERCQSLALEAASRLEAVGIANVEIAWADGLATPAQAGPFDRIIVHALLSEPPVSFAKLLAGSGVLVAAHATAIDGAKEQRVARFHHNGEGGWAIETLGPARSFAPLVEGLARGL
jgi:protein-L-isoaspartate(D-aspartate) O-methyltransferase